MRRIVMLMSCILVSNGCSWVLGVNDVTAGDGGATANGNPPGAAPRLISPPSMATVTQQRPTLRWTFGTLSGTPIVDLCTDRSCATLVPIIAQIEEDRVTAVPTVPLPTGWIFWRVRLISGSTTLSSATWQFWVDKSDSSSSASAGYGTILDVNGDGYPDFLVGASGASAGRGIAYLYLGSPTTSATDWNASSSLTRINLTSPDDANTSFGYSMSSAGDVNGDGYGDFLIGAYGTDSNTGSVHLYLGSAAPTAGNWNGASASARIDITSPDAAEGVFGASVAGAGDVDRDGYADFLVGAPKAEMAHLYLGSAAPGAADWNGNTRRIDLTSPQRPAAFADSVAGAGDINGDGYADFLIGADATNAGDGAAYLYLGSMSPSADAWNMPLPTQRIDLGNLDGAHASFGSCVASAGDINGDGYIEFLVAARSADNNAGSVHLYFGSATPDPTVWNTATPTARIDITNPDGTDALFGASVASAGDVNGDGYTDFVIGAEGASEGAGAAHLYLGTAAPSLTTWNVSLGTARIDLLDPDGAAARFGAAVVSAGDINGDGYIDFLVGARDANFLEGAAQIYLGSTSPAATEWNASPTPMRLDLMSPAGMNARFGISVTVTDRIGIDNDVKS